MFEIIIENNLKISFSITAEYKNDMIDGASILTEKK